MIDIENEEVVPLGVVPRHLPSRRSGKRIHISCIYRWTTSGCKGVLLESIQIGGTRCTSLQALSRFFAALSLQGSETRVELSSRRQKAADQARKSLEREGI